MTTLTWLSLNPSMNRLSSSSSSSSSSAYVNSQQRPQNKSVFQTKPKLRSIVTNSPNSKMGSRDLSFEKSLFPFTACLAVLLWSSPANAGFLSGSTGLESVPGPELPKIEFLNQWNDENQKKYAEADARFKESPLLKQYLEKSKLNKEKNQQSIQDKYCLRGAEWGIGDCSAEGMSPEDREKFIAMLKKKVGVE